MFAAARSFCFVVWSLCSMYHHPRRLLFLPGCHPSHDYAKHEHERSHCWYRLGNNELACPSRRVRSRIIENVEGAWTTPPLLPFQKTGSSAMTPTSLDS
ncbi:hypothetical protein BDN72DRAFT_965520 [Pluteus cervinus]|uniref:Uncharacterized protein n=1 Tax=Pluteus cervinus TaxID=181527 RepID=A0ACD3A7H3_9AGAR|nr:hypothetical protein BDN72DRAFT_965520 [Pluteus cervinus]